MFLPARRRVREMSDRDQASQKLEAAIDRLEEIVLAERARRGELQEALERSAADNERLRGVAGDVSGRLDAAIARLQTILGE